MRTFIQKAKTTRQTSSRKSLMLSPTPGRQGLSPNSIFNLQHAIGNEALLRLPQSNTEERYAVLTGAKSLRFGHDFRLIPARPNSGALQTKLTVNKPGDEYEQEADRVAEQVMRMPEPWLQRACPCGGGCPKCQSEEMVRQQSASATNQSPVWTRAHSFHPPLPLQSKLTINQPGDSYEQEADQLADHIMRMPLSALQSRACGSASGPDGDYAACEANHLDWHRKGDKIPRNEAPTTVYQTVRKPGHPLDSATRALMEARFGQDFSGVRVHSDAQAAQSAIEVDAQAYTVGQNVVFGAGRYAPGTTQGQKLLAHELTHVLQQNHPLSRKPPVVMRQHGGGRRHQVTPTTFHQQLFVVRDPSIGLGGGHLVADLAAFKTDVMRLHNTGTWTLVLAIHGSLDRIAAQAPPNWQHNAVFYTAADINTLFNGDSAWVQWRDTYGPSHLALVSCQVSASFEGVMINNLTRHVTAAGSSTAAPTQSARGMGTHCKPLSASQSYEYPSGTAITTRRQYQQLPASAKSDMESTLSILNSKYGYYGAAPVPNNQILDYYFDVDPRGAWANVTVGVDQGGNVSDTDIPFWNRTTGPRSAEFRRLCDQGVGRLTRPHIPRGP